ncbi:hypothetical protein LTR85_007065 [Meristemomyces frigidus]|nr:hypothetical protein LTR85_007065 [Meristemomyces frigidus]
MAPMNTTFHTMPTNGTYHPTASEIQHAGRMLYIFLTIAGLTLPFGVLNLLFTWASRLIPLKADSNVTKASFEALGALLFTAASVAVHYWLAYSSSWQFELLVTTFGVSASATIWVCAVGVVGLVIDALTACFWIICLGCEAFRFLALGWKRIRDMGFGKTAPLPYSTSNVVEDPNKVVSEV